MACVKCDDQGHVFDEKAGVWKRCICLEREVLVQQLGPFFKTDQPVSKTSLSALLDKSLLLDTPLQTVRPHIARIILDLAEQKKTFEVMDCYRLIDIFLEKDDEHTTNQAFMECDLLILLVGFGDPRNRYLPELMMQVLGRREILRLPTWVVLGIEVGAIGMKYNAEVAERLAKFKRVSVR